MDSFNNLVQKRTDLENELKNINEQIKNHQVTKNNNINKGISFFKDFTKFDDNHEAIQFIKKNLIDCNFKVIRYEEFYKSGTIVFTFRSYKLKYYLMCADGDDACEVTIIDIKNNVKYKCDLFHWDKHYDKFIAENNIENLRFFKKYKSLFLNLGTPPENKYNVEYDYLYNKYNEL